MTCERKGRPGFVPGLDQGTAHLQPRSKDRPFAEISKMARRLCAEAVHDTVAVHLASCLKFAWGLHKRAGVRVNHGQSSHWPQGSQLARPLLRFARNAFRQ
jgi:hypothetical protein